MFRVRRESGLWVRKREVECKPCIICSLHMFRLWLFVAGNHFLRKFLMLYLLLLLMDSCDLCFNPLDSRLEPGKSSSHHQVLFLLRYILKYHSIYICVFHVFSFLYIFWLKFCTYFSSYHACCVPYPSHPLWFDHPNSSLIYYKSPHYAVA